MQREEEFCLEPLTGDGLVILQPRRGYRFSLDAVLLARFPEVGDGCKIIDLGTGSGVIPLLLSTRAKNLSILGIELQPRLAALAKRNVRLNHLQGIVTVLERDINNLPREYNGKWDLVVANPPYFKAGSGKPGGGERALARHELACTLQDVIRCAARLLKPGGRFALVHRAERLPEALGLLAEFKLSPRYLKMVHPRAGGKGELFLLEAVKGLTQTLAVLAPLIIYDNAGAYTPAMQRIYAGRSVREAEEI